MIIVEGPDGAGKSTLCKQLEASGIVDQVLLSPRLAAAGNPMRMKAETGRYLRIYGDKKVAVDRLLFSEMVYGEVIRNGSAFSRGEYLNTLLHIQVTFSPIIFCLPKNLNYKPEESKFIIEKSPQLVAEYEKYFTQVSEIYPFCIRYDWEELNAFDKLKTKIRKIRKESRVKP